MRKVWLDKFKPFSFWNGFWLMNMDIIRPCVCECISAMLYVYLFVEWINSRPLLLWNNFDIDIMIAMLFL